MATEHRGLSASRSPPWLPECPSAASQTHQSCGLPSPLAGKISNQLFFRCRHVQNCLRKSSRTTSKIIINPELTLCRKVSSRAKIEPVRSRKVWNVLRVRKAKRTYGPNIFQTFSDRRVSTFAQESFYLCVSRPLFSGCQIWKLEEGVNES